MICFPAAFVVNHDTGLRFTIQLIIPKHLYTDSYYSFKAPRRGYIEIKKLQHVWTYPLQQPQFILIKEITKDISSSTWQQYISLHIGQLKQNRRQ